MRRRCTFAGVLAGLLAAAGIFPPSAAAQGITLNWYTLGGGGGAGAAGQVALKGTLGQADAGRLSAGGLTLRGGFWRGGSVVSSVPGPDRDDGAPGPGRPMTFHLRGAAPNPAAPATVVSFELAQAGPVQVELFDLDGRRVRALWSGRRESGAHRLSWDGRDDAGRPVASGVYLVRLVAGDRIAHAKILLTRR